MFLTRENSELREQNEVSRQPRPLSGHPQLSLRRALPLARCSFVSAFVHSSAQILRRVLSREVDSSVMELLEYLRSENQALKVAVYDTAHTLAQTTGALEKGLPHAATAIAAALAEEAAAAGGVAAAPGGPGLPAGLPASAGSSSSSSSVAPASAPGH